MKSNFLIFSIIISFLAETDILYPGSIEGRLFFSSEAERIIKTSRPAIIVGAFYTRESFEIYPYVPDYTTMANDDFSFSFPNLVDSTYFVLAWADQNLDGQPEVSGILCMAENKPFPIKVSGKDTRKLISIELKPLQHDANYIEGIISYRGKLKFQEIIIMAASEGDKFNPQRKRFFTQITSPGYFRLNNLPQGSYYLFAIIDTNGDFKEEALGYYHQSNELPEPIRIKGNPVKTSVNITISDIFDTENDETVQCMVINKH